jgi:NTP pyrophosphatase (non-canonical NTP hydrolase)
MDSREARDIITRNVARRGYRKGWTLDQFIARNIAKLQEELAEASEHVRGDGFLGDVIWRAGRAARGTFDLHEAWSGAVVTDPEKLREELADVMVVILNMAAVVEELTGRDYDVVWEAVRKSQEDVARGVRANGNSNATD